MKTLKLYTDKSGQMMVHDQESGFTYYSYRKPDEQEEAFIIRVKKQLKQHYHNLTVEIV